MQGEQMLTGPIVNERKILLCGGEGRAIIYHHTVRRNTHKKLVLSFVVLIAEMAKKIWSVMYEPSERADRWTDATKNIVSLLH